MDTLKPAIPLTDPTSSQSETSPSDIARTPTPITAAESDLFNRTMDYFKAAAIGRRPFEPMVLESWAFYLGRQDVRATFSQGNWGLQEIRTRSPHKTYQHRNKIRPRIKRMLAQALRNDPDKTVAPWTGSNRDRAAAMIGRAVDAHFVIAHDDKHTLWQAARWAAITSTTYEKYWWNPKAWAEVPTGFDADNNPSGSTLAQVGTIERCLVPWIEAYPDPDAREPDQVRWFIHAKEESLEVIKDNYVNGWMVEGGVPTDLRGAISTSVANVTGGYPKGNNPLRTGRTQTVYEVWERPTAAYPERWQPATPEEQERDPSYKGRWIAGRWWTCTGDGRVMKQPEPLPEWCRNPANGAWELPFNHIRYETPVGTLHALNAVHDLVGAQREYNNAVSRMSEMLKTTYGKILACEGSQISTTAFDSAKDNEVVYWKPNPGGPPVHLPAPAPNPVAMEVLALCEKDMQDMAAQHEVTQGETPPQVTAASAIKLLQDADTTQIADFTQELEGFIERRCSWRLRIARYYFKEPRLLFLAQTKGTKTNAPPISPMAPQANPESPMGQFPANNIAPGMSSSPVVGSPQGLAPNPTQGPPPPTIEPQGMPSPLMQAQTFENFTAGSLRVMITPGSMTPKSPEANAELVIKLADMELFGPKGSPAAAKLILQELEIMDPNTVYETMLQAQADQAANAPDPVAAAKQQAMIQGIMDGAMEGARAHREIAVEQVRQQGRMELAEQEDSFNKELEAIRAHVGMRSVEHSVSLNGASGDQSKKKEKANA